MPTSGASESVENFIKAVYILEQASERVSTNALRHALGISAPSVTDMAQRLVDSGLVDYKKYRGVRLTEEGRSMALGLLRRHRLIELYLVRELGYELHEVHDEAEILEHAVSDRFIEAIDSILNYPEFDPHGDPIPNVDGTITRRNLCTLNDLPLETSARISRLVSQDPEMLQHALNRGFSLHAEVRVLARDPFNGPVTVLLGAEETVIGHTVAEGILVEIVG